MAYDQASTYQAPRRAYYDQQQHQQAPVPRQNGGYPPQQQYDNYDQSYDQGYGQSRQQYGGYDDQAYGMNQQHGQYYGDDGSGNSYGYEQYDRGYPAQDHGRQDYRQQDGYGRSNEGYANGHYDNYNSQDRQYDPRYQQRPGRGDRPPPNGARGQRPPPPGNADYRGQPPQPRKQDPRNGHPQDRHGYPDQSQHRYEQDARNGHRDRRDPREQPSKRPTPPANDGPRQAPPPAQDPKKSAMEEWKAKEKARMHEAANKPKIMPQDNAFPTFGNKKDGETKTTRSSEEHGRPSTSAGGREPKSTRSSEEHGRPSTASGRHGSRPGSSKSNQQQQMSPPPAVNGQQPYGNRAPQPFSPIHEQPSQENFQQYANGNGDYGYNQPGQQQWQTSAHPMRPEPQPHRPPPINTNRQPQSYNDSSHPRKPVAAAAAEPVRPTPPAPQPEPATQSDEYYPQESWRTGPPKKRPQAQGQPQSEPSKPQESWRTGPGNPLAQEQFTAPPPAVAPQPVRQQTMPAPQSAPPVAHHMPERVFSPASQESRSGTPRAQAQAPNFARPHVAPVAPAVNPSLDDVYDDYYAPDDHVNVPPPPKNREEEIEAEMPDFDSAAPGQTSSLHKRHQTVDKHLNGSQAEAAPPMPTIHSQQANPSVQSLPVQGNQPYSYNQEAAVASQPEFRDVRHDQNGPSDGFVFGVPGEQFRPQQQYEEPSHMQPRQQPQAYRPVQSVPPENMRRFQSPVDQRGMQMPMRGGPPGEHPQGQRFHPGGRGPLPPQQRSASTRPPMTHAQTGWSDPGMQRAPTAPPMRQDSHGALHQGMPRTGSLTNQQHQHRAPSAPPGPQNMRGMPPGGPRNGSLTQGSRPPPQEQRRSDPDALPHHPTPFRPGLMEQQGAPQPPKPASVRNYDARSSTSSHNRGFSVSDKPITKADLEQARLDHEASRASPRLALRYAKKLVEASHVLASEGGRLDAKTTQRNREKYLNEAYKRVKDLVRNAYPEAQFYMAECYGSGELGLEVDPKEAFGLYLAAAKGGHAAAAFRTAVSCEIGPEDGGGTRRDYPKAVQWYRRAAALGDGAAMFKLGIILLRALLGVPRNVGEAVIWLKRAAERADKDNPHALHELAALHEPTNDPAVREKVIPDEGYALSLYKQAAELGFKRSQFRLGQAYEYGSLGLEIDNRASIAWYTKAAAQGEHNAELALSGWYLTGAEGMLEQSDMEAYLWARKAAQSEPPLAKAMFAMGYFTEQGIGCPKSLEEAKRWYGRAASFQFPRALERLEELKKGGNKKAMQGKLTRDKKKDEENCVVM